MSTGLLLQFSLANEMDEVAEDLAEKTRRRPGRKGTRRNRPKRTPEQEGIFYSAKDAMADAHQRALDETAAQMRKESEYGLGTENRPMSWRVGGMTVNR